jgi:hypothetical protein
MRLVLIAGAVAACSSDRITPSITAPTARSSASKAPATSDPIVSSTSPDTGQQGTTIDVQVNGSNFTAGAVATWALHGSPDPKQVRTVSTRYVNSHALIATISIAGTATLDAWDVQVSLSSGKNGVGSELFTIKPQDPTATFAIPLSDASLSLRSDHLYNDGTSSLYAKGVCGVDAKIFATTAASNSGDAVMQTDNPAFSDRKCANYPRRITLAYSDGVSETITVFMNLHDLEKTSYAIPIGSSATRAFVIAPIVTTRCAKLQWGAGGNGDSLVVTRTAADTWQVRTQDAPNDNAFCTTTGRPYEMPVQFTIVASRALP